MSRTLGLFAVLLGTTLVLVALLGILRGPLAAAAGWRRFVAAIVAVVSGIGSIAWGGTKYAGVGARI